MILKKLLFLTLATSLAICILPNSTIYVKTNNLNATPHELQDFKDQLAGKPKPGYCERKLNNLYYVSNKAWCGGSTDRNIVYYVNVTFSLAVGKHNYSFTLPSNFGFGGISMIDGVIKK